MSRRKKTLFIIKRCNFCLFRVVFFFWWEGAFAVKALYFPQPLDYIIFFFLIPYLCTYEGYILDNCTTRIKPGNFQHKLIPKNLTAFCSHKIALCTHFSIDVGYVVVLSNHFPWLSFLLALAGTVQSFAWWTYDCFGVYEGELVYSYFNISLTGTHSYLLMYGRVVG